MPQSSSKSLVHSFVRQLKKLASGLSEKPALTMDDYLLEHILLYHGLTGSSPEGQPETLDVQSDIRQAVERKSSAELCIALKLKPLRWEDRLQAIFSELAKDNLEATVSTLLNDHGQPDPDPSGTPLKHEDWQVRSNAASILALLKVQQAVPQLAQSLKEAGSGTARPSFCHVAYSLGRLGGEKARQELTSYLNDKEPWFAVDAARSLCLWPEEAVAQDLALAMLSLNPFSDYMAVVIAREYEIKNWLEQPELVSGALEIIIGVLKASTGTFALDTVFETKIYQCWPQLYTNSKNLLDPAAISATMSLGLWLKQNLDLLSDEHCSGLNLTAGELLFQIDCLLEELKSDKVKTSVINRLQEIDFSAAHDSTSAARTIDLCGQLQLHAAVHPLLKLLQAKSLYRDQVVAALGKIGESDTCTQLIALAGEIIDLDQRTSQSESKQPVAEEAPDNARTYWLILKALGNLHDQSSIDFLLKASNDFAPDKREQALESLLNLSEKLTLSPAREEQLDLLISRRLEDSAPTVKILALQGAGQHSVISQLPKIVKLAFAREPSVGKQAFASLRQLSQNGFKTQVLEELHSAARKPFAADQHNRLSDFAKSL